MLIGLSSKNAILIVEFAEQLRERGLPLVEATVEAARIRLRPILMTSFAFILGVVPLMVAHGAGQEGRHSVGTTVFGGMIMSTVLNLLVIPVLYLIIEGWRVARQGTRPRTRACTRRLIFSYGRPHVSQEECGRTGRPASTLDL
jgi:Cu/Ag efflux pump CusA